MKKQNRVWRVGLYIRLSQDDKDKSVSNSVINQTNLLISYISTDPTLEIVNTYKDDGYSGLNFNRPQFKRIINDMENDIIDCIVVKDLSRFGREHIDVSNYLERTFPTKNIRFISVKERLDSVKYPKRMNSIEVSFITLLNEEYSRDISNKTKASLITKRKQGKYTGSKAPYGFIKNPRDKHHLIADDESKGIIQDIFKWYIGGKSINEITQTLNDNMADTPRVRRAKLRNISCSLDKWNRHTIRKILSEDLYTGDMVQGKTVAYNYKVKKRLPVPKEDWIIVKDTHEAIVSHNTFDIAQELLSKGAKPKQKTEASLLARYVICGNCGETMVRHIARKKGVSYNTMVCPTSKKAGNDLCKNHSLDESVLVDVIIEAIKKQVDCIADIKKVFSKIQKQQLNKKGVNYYHEQVKTLEHKQKRVLVYKKGLYEDLKNDIISITEYNDYKKKYQFQYDELQQQIKQFSEKINDIKLNHKDDIELFDKVKSLSKIDSLSRELVVELIDSIHVYHDRTIDINFKFKDELKKLEHIIAS